MSGGFFVHGRSIEPGARSCGPGMYKERRQQVAVLHLSGRNDLRNVERVQFRPTGGLARGVDIGDRDVRGTEINSDEVAGHRPNLYLAGDNGTFNFRTGHRRGEPEGRNC